LLGLGLGLRLSKAFRGRFGSGSKTYGLRFSKGEVKGKRVKVCWVRESSQRRKVLVGVWG
jgi:hypothetical protein